jgi:hypothetical protein
MKNLAGPATDLVLALPGFSLWSRKKGNKKGHPFARMAFLDGLFGLVSPTTNG